MPADSDAHLSELEERSETGVRVVAEVVAPPLSTLAVAKTVEQIEGASSAPAPVTKKGPSPDIFTNMNTAKKAGIIRPAPEVPAVDPWGTEKIRLLLRNAVMSRADGTWMTEAEIIDGVVKTLRKSFGMPLEHATDAYRGQIGSIVAKTEGIDPHKRYPEVIRLLSPHVQGSEREASTQQLGREFQILEANAAALIDAVTAEGGRVLREDELMHLRGTVEPHLSFKKNNGRYNGVLSVILQSNPRVEVAVNDLGKKIFTLYPVPAQ